MAKFPSYLARLMILARPVRYIPIILILLIGASCSDVNEVSATFCRETEDVYLQRGVIVSVTDNDGTRVEVDEVIWNGLPDDAKVSLSLSAYCQIMDADGRGTVRIVGWNDGKPKGSFTDGNWQSP